MALPFALPENFKIVNCSLIAAGDSMVYDIISCKHAHKVWFIYQNTGENDTDATLSLVEAASVAGSTTSAVTATFPVWENIDTAGGDTLTRVTTDAASYLVNIGAGGTNQMIVIEWDPAKHSDGYDCIQVADTGGHNTNRATCLAIIETRYPEASPPSVIID